jgi:TatD DNase family protein
MIDSHCHLADKAFDADLEQVVVRARRGGVERILVILEAGDDAEAAQAARVAALWPESRLAIGVHPHHAERYAADPEDAARRVRAQIAGTPDARAVGEIGLDYHYDLSPREIQQQVFRAQLRLAGELQLPVVVHTREADADTLAAIREEGQGAIRGVLHCFTGTPDLARAALDLGFFISLAGIVTFPKASALRETARIVPLDRLLVETDSPFLAPVPHRGGRNEPGHVVHVAEALASLHGIDLGDLDRATSANFHSLFRP